MVFVHSQTLQHGPASRFLQWTPRFTHLEHWTCEGPISLSVPVCPYSQRLLGEAPIGESLPRHVWSSRRRTATGHPWTLNQFILLLMSTLMKLHQVNEPLHGVSLLSRMHRLGLLCVPSFLIDIVVFDSIENMWSPIGQGTSSVERGFTCSDK